VRSLVQNMFTLLASWPEGTPHKVVLVMLTALSLVQTGQVTLGGRIPAHAGILASPAFVRHRRIQLSVMLLNTAVTEVMSNAPQWRSLVSSHTCWA
jgi:hypothetical protein